jgi:hypothetical protein
VLHGLSPWQQFQLSVADTSIGVNCGNLAQQFAFFCAAENITVRMIEVMNPGDHHVLNEVFLPETKQWVAVDATMDRTLFMNGGGEPMNFYQLKGYLGAGKPVYTLRSNGKDLLDTTAYETAHYYRPPFTLHYFSRLETPALYSAGNKLRMFLLPENWFTIYGKPRIPWMYLLKSMVLIAWLFSFFKIMHQRIRYIFP